MYSYVARGEGKLQLIRIDNLISDGEEYVDDNQAYTCYHIVLTHGTYGYLLPKDMLFNRQDAIGHINHVKPNPLIV